jgi:hypothetical protein
VSPPDGRRAREDPVKNGAAGLLSGFSPLQARVQPRGDSILGPPSGDRMRSLPLCSLVLVLGGGLAAQVVTGLEPDDTPSQANPIACGVHVEGNIAYSGDLDWYVFTLAAPGRVLAQIGTGTDGVVTDTAMELHGDLPGLQLLAYNDDDNRDWMSVISRWLPAGTYYLMARGYGSSTGFYSLDLQCDPQGVATPYVAELIEPNGPFGVGAPSLLALGEIGEGSLGAGDIDSWQFTLAAPAAIRAETGQGLVGTAVIDTVMTLYDAQGLQLVYDDDGAPGAWSLVMATLPAGSYTLDVAGYSISNTGSYTLLLEGFDTTNALTEFPEPNESSATASIAVCGLPATGEITAGDLDWWLLVPGASGFVNIEVWCGLAAATTVPLENPVLRVRDANGALLAEDDNGFYDRTSRLGIWLDPTGVYYVEVAGSGGNDAGTYTLAITCGRSAGYHSFAGGCAGSNSLVPRWNVRAWELPLAGTTLVGEFTAGPAFAPLFRIAGFDRTQSASLPLPFDLAAFGAPGCLVAIDPAVSQLAFTDAGGADSWPFPIPFTTALSGVVFGQQGALLDPGANALGVTLTNLGIGLISTVR